MSQALDRNKTQHLSHESVQGQAWVPHLSQEHDSHQCATWGHPWHLLSSPSPNPSVCPPWKEDQLSVTPWHWQVRQTTPWDKWLKMNWPTPVGHKDCMKQGNKWQVQVLQEWDSMTIDTMQNLFFVSRAVVSRAFFFFMSVTWSILIKQIYYYDEPYLIRQSWQKCTVLSK